MTIIIITPEAVSDLKEIGRYIARDSPDRAISYVRALKNKIEKIGQNPQIYPLREDLQANIRSVSYHRYLIFFQIVESHTVEIIRIMHGARDIEGAFEL